MTFQLLPWECPSNGLLLATVLGAAQFLCSLVLSYFAVMVNVAQLDTEEALAPSWLAR